jgi:nitrite reductase (NO-forming)
MSSRRRTLFGVMLVAALVPLAILALTGARREASPEVVDFGKTPRATVPAWDATLRPASRAPVKEFHIPITHGRIEIAPGKFYEGWLFGGTVPGPVLRVRQGDRVRIVVTNDSPMPHSIDFHAARIPMNDAFGPILPGQSKSFEFTADDPGAFMVHCGTAPVLTHIMNGMYFAMIVDPANGWGTDADKEFVLVQSEFYAQPDSATGELKMDRPAAAHRDASYVVFNGTAWQYKRHPLMVDEGDRVRFFVVNAGPNFTSDFHIVGAIFDRVYPDGRPGNVLEGVQTYGIPAGGGAVFETTFAKGKSGEGMYAFVTHAFADAEKGAVGVIQVGSPAGANAMAMH